MTKSKVDKSRKKPVAKKTTTKTKAKKTTKKAPKRGRKPGTPKTGGRKKGTPNKNSLTLRKALDEQGFNLVLEYVLAIQQLEGNAKINELRYLMKFAYPTLNSVDVVPHETPPSESPKKQTSSEERLNLIRGSFARKS